MTKKDYVLVAKCVKATVVICKDLPEPERSWQMSAFRHLVGQLVSKFMQDNPKFDKAKFINACGLKEVQ